MYKMKLNCFHISYKLDSQAYSINEIFSEVLMPEENLNKPIQTRLRSDSVDTKATN